MQQQPRAQHGTEATYRAGCRCEACRKAATKAKRLRRERESQPGFGTPSLLPKRELLTSQRGADSLWHASYPTGTMTLCGKDVQPYKPVEAWPPTCAVCMTTALKFDQIDQSMPPQWHAYDVVPPTERNAA